MTMFVASKPRLV